MKAFIAALLTATLARASSKLIPINDPSITVSGGRFVRNATALAFDWTAVTFTTTICGGSISLIMFENRPNKYFIDVDGEGTYFVTVAGHQALPVVESTSAMQHRIQITKVTEPDFNDGSVTPRDSRVYVYGFSVGRPCTLRGGRAATQPLATRRIEFIGDSLTAGYGSMGVPSCSGSVENSNWWVTYDHLICEKFNSECHVEAWSGKGLVVNLNQQGPTMWGMYPRTFATVPDIPWNFSQWIPDAVFINLGTNDYNSHAPPSAQVWVTAYMRLMAMLQQQYGSGVKIFAGVGPATDSYATNTHLAVQAGIEAGYNVTYVNMFGATPNNTYKGCAGHPNAAGHRRMADMAVPVMKSVLGW